MKLFKDKRIREFMKMYLAFLLGVLIGATWAIHRFEELLK